MDFYSLNHSSTGRDKLEREGPLGFVQAVQQPGPSLAHSTESQGEGAGHCRRA